MLAAVAMTPRPAGPDRGACRSAPVGPLYPRPAGAGQGWPGVVMSGQERTGGARESPRRVRGAVLPPGAFGLSPGEDPASKRSTRTGGPSGAQKIPAGARASPAGAQLTIG